MGSLKNRVKDRISGLKDKVEKILARGISQQERKEIDGKERNLCVFVGG